MNFDIDALPDGYLYAAYGDNGYVQIQSEAHLTELLDAARELAAAEEIGQLLQITVSLDVTWIVWMDVPGGLGWALTHDDAPEHMISVGDRTRVGNPYVELKMGRDWEEQRPQAFIAEVLARAATIEFVRTAGRPTTVDWEPNF